jgi:hypothetical protein
MRGFPPRRCFWRVAAARRRGAGGDGSVERVCGGGASGGRRRRRTCAGADWVGFSPGEPFYTDAVKRNRRLGFALRNDPTAGKFGFTRKRVV